MKKLISLVVVALLLCTMTVSGLAKVSFGPIEQPTPAKVEDVPEGNTGVTTIIAMYDEEERESITVEEIESTLTENNYVLDKEASDIDESITDGAVGSSVAYAHEGKNDNLVYGAIAGVSDEVLSQFVLLVMSAEPIGGQYRYAYIQLNSENVDTETGKFTGQLPFDGYVVLIAK